MTIVGFHGRGGQGVETAVRLLSDASGASQGFFFPTQERRGAHVYGLVKISNALSKQVERTDFLLVFDKTLNFNEVIADVKDGGILIVNSPEKLKLASLKKRKIKSYNLDATSIAMEHIQSPIPNTAMLGAFTQLSEVTLKSMKKVVKEMDDNNIDAFKAGYDAV